MKNRIMEMIVGGLTGLAVVVIYIIARGYLDKAEAGDWLAFAGVFLGTGGAVVGALYVDDRRRKAERRQELELVRGAMLDMRSAIEHSTTEHSLKPLNEELKRLHDALIAIDDACTMLSFAVERSTVAIRSMLLFRSILEVQKQMGNYRTEILSETAILADPRKVSVQVLAITRDKMTRIHRDLRPSLDAGIEACD